MDVLRTFTHELCGSLRRVGCWRTSGRWVLVSVRRKKNLLLIVGILFMFYMLYDQEDTADTRTTRRRTTMTQMKKAVDDQRKEHGDWHRLEQVHKLSDIESEFYYNDGRRRKNKTEVQSNVLPKVELPKKLPEKVVNKVEAAVAKPVPKASKSKPRQDHPCDLERLSINDTDESRDLDHCFLPDISGNPKLENAINTLGQLDLPLLQNYRSPCWYEALPPVTEYNSKMHMFWWQIKDSFDRISKIIQERRKAGHHWRLRCLPLVYIIGLTRSGSQDLYNILIGHPFIVKPATKEPFYWDRNRWKHDSKFPSYLELFDEAAEKIRTYSFPRKMWQRNIVYHPKVTLDASVNYLFEFGRLNQISGNQDMQNPVHLLPHVISNLTPSKDIKVFLTIRNPTERAFACYSSYEDHRKSNKSAGEFHEIVTRQISYLNDCFMKHPLRYCLHNDRVTKSMKKVELHVGVYVGYVMEWIEVLPKMTIIRWEDLKDNRGAVYKKVVESIGLYADPKTIPTNKAQEIDVDPGFFMWKRTKVLLDEFYRPYNKKLAELLNDKRYEYS